MNLISKRLSNCEIFFINTIGVVAHAAVESSTTAQLWIFVTIFLNRCLSTGMSFMEIRFLSSACGLPSPKPHLPTKAQTLSLRFWIENVKRNKHEKIQKWKRLIVNYITAYSNFVFQKE